MFVCGELKTYGISLVVIELTPTDKAYLSFHKLVPVVIRKRSEKRKRKRQVLNIKAKHIKKLCSVRVSGSVIPVGFVGLIEEFKT